MKKVLLTALSVLAITAAGVANAAPETTSSRSACPVNSTTGECLKNAGSALVTGTKDAGSAVANSTTAAAKTVVNGAKDAGQSIGNTFSSSKSSSTSAQPQTQSQNNQ